MFLFHFPGAHILAKNSFSILNGSIFQFLKCVFIIIFRPVNSLFIVQELFFKSKSDFDFISYNIFLHKWHSSRKVFVCFVLIFFKETDSIVSEEENVGFGVRPKIDSYLSHFL